MCAIAGTLAAPAAAQTRVETQPRTDSPARGDARARADAPHARPAALVPLYVAYAGLQALDAHSTLSAIEAGGREANPMVRGTLGNPAGMFLLKSGSAAAVVFLSEKVWRRNRTAAVITMVALNSAYATIAAHNYRSTHPR
jgi:hypothetical protein